MAAKAGNQGSEVLKITDELIADTLSEYEE
jgi:hypothetical protein